MTIDWEALQRAGGIGKGEPRTRTKGRKKRQRRQTTTDVRTYVFARERNICRCCRFRPADSMHELRPRSVGGKVSRRNSIAVCGDGVRGCHGLLQRKAITFGWAVEIGAEGNLHFVAETPTAAEWLRVRRRGYVIFSPVMHETEQADF